MIVIHRDRLVLASTAQWSEIQRLVSRGQIVSADPPLLTDGQTDRQIAILLICHLYLLQQDLGTLAGAYMYSERYRESSLHS